MPSVCQCGIVCVSFISMSVWVGVHIHHISKCGKLFAKFTYQRKSPLHISYTFLHTQRCIQSDMSQVARTCWLAWKKMVGANNGKNGWVYIQNFSEVSLVWVLKVRKHMMLNRPSPNLQHYIAILLVMPWRMRNHLNAWLWTILCAELQFFIKNYIPILNCSI